MVGVVEVVEAAAAVAVVQHTYWGNSTLGASVPDCRADETLAGSSSAQEQLGTVGCPCKSLQMVLAHTCHHLDTCSRHDLDNDRQIEAADSVVSVTDCDHNVH